MEGGRAVGLGVARCAPYLVDSELPDCSIRRILLADVLTDLLQFEADGGHGIFDSTRPVKCLLPARPAGRARKPLARRSGASMPCALGWSVRSGERSGGEHPDRLQLSLL
jgi:hypothetical protein